ncbi:single-stranded DNA-binding protein [Nocardioides sp. Bht2]|uniref:single-stranded DNA-binding protein n=1 Tax=Nocardioides sp. Bht2 TaxID=3392297 RepID=UPI0039B3D6D8
MAVIICFEGQLDAIPTMTNDPQRSAAATATSKRYRNGLPTGSSTPGPRFELRATGRLADQLATLEAGTTIVVIGHVQTERWTDETGQTRYTDVVQLQSLGVVPEQA